MPSTWNVSFDHLEHLTDDTGILQHAKFSVPARRSGYATDDNARALSVASRWYSHGASEKALKLVNTYLCFLLHAQRDDGYFHNFLSPSREWLDARGTQDCQGRVLMGLEDALACGVPDGINRCAREMFDRACAVVPQITSPRACGLIATAISRGMRHLGSEDLIELLRTPVSRLISSYRCVADGDWRWFEDVITYANAVMCQGLFEAYLTSHEEETLEVAAESLSFLEELCLKNGMFVPIGNRGWHKRGGGRPVYDQQPIEASTMMDAELAAFEATGDRERIEVAELVLAWFHGNNTLGTSLADRARGACRDGLTAKEPNLNEGAESTLSYLSAEMNYQRLKERHNSRL